MATPTPNYGLMKADEGEKYDVNLTNTNLTTIDAQMKINADKIKKAPKVIGWAGNGSTFGASAHTAIAAGTADMLWLPGSVSITTDAQGYSGIDLPSPFPNGYYVVSLTNGDNAAQGNIGIHVSTGIFTNTLSRFYVRVINNGTGVPIVGQVRVNFLCVGW